MPQIEDWQNRSLAEVYSVLYIDAIHYSVRDNGVIKKLAAYVILGIDLDGHKEVLTIQVGDNESSKYWLSVLNELKNRGVRDINTLKYVSDKDRSLSTTMSILVSILLSANTFSRLSVSFSLC